MKQLSNIYLYETLNNYLFFFFFILFSTKLNLDTHPLTFLGKLDIDPSVNITVDGFKSWNGFSIFLIIFLGPLNVEPLFATGTAASINYKFKQDLLAGKRHV